MVDWDLIPQGDSNLTRVTPNINRKEWLNGTFIAQLSQTLWFISQNFIILTERISFFVVFFYFIVQLSVFLIFLLYIKFMVNLMFFPSFFRSHCTCRKSCPRTRKKTTRQECEKEAHKMTHNTSSNKSDQKTDCCFFRLICFCVGVTELRTKRFQI